MKYISTLLLIGIFACANTKNAESPKNPIEAKVDQDTSLKSLNEINPSTTIRNDVDSTAKIKISITHHSQYCGGMAPSQDMLDKLHKPEANTVFLLINLSTKIKTELKTDSVGSIFLDLDIGKYAIKEAYKDCSFDEFQKRNNKYQGENYLPTQEPDCLKNWWKSNLLEFEITDTDAVYRFDCNTYDQCFTGRNPCVAYVGPKPP